MADADVAAFEARAMTEEIRISADIEPGCVVDADPDDCGRSWRP